MFLSLFWDKASRKGLDLAAFVEPDVPASILADPVRLNQVLSNLVNNALKFTDEGHVAIMVRLIADTGSQGPGGVIEFSVSDTGIGIPADKLETVFEAFTQADQSTTRRFGGTGLGLPICKRFGRCHGRNDNRPKHSREGFEIYHAVSCPPGDRSQPAAGA